MILEEERAYRTLFFRQEKSLQDHLAALANECHARIMKYA